MPSYGKLPIAGTVPAIPPAIAGRKGGLEAMDTDDGQGAEALREKSPLKAKPFLNYDDVSQILGVALPTLYQWVRTGRVPSPTYLGALARFEPALLQLCGEGKDVAAAEVEQV